MARSVLIEVVVRKLSCVLLVVLGACGFMPLSAEVQPDAQSGSSTPPPLTSDAAASACHSKLPGVVLCLDFEDPSLASIAHDSSAGGHDATIANVSPTARGTQQAATVIAASTITVPEASALDLSGPLTIELWVDAQSSDQGDTLFEHEDDFGIDFNHTPGCYINDSDDIWAPDPLPPGWHHVACTWDGATIRTYVDGAIVACAGMHQSLHADAAQVEISRSFSGAIDDVHLYDRALAPSEVQGLAGTTSTAIACP